MMYLGYSNGQTKRMAGVFIMKRKLACLLLITATLVTNLSIAWADESAGAAASDNAAYTEALAQLSAEGVDSVSTAITDNKGMNLAIDLGLLDGEESMDLARLSAQAHVVQTQQLNDRLTNLEDRFDAIQREAHAQPDQQDLLDRRAVDLSRTEFLVLDEADQMLDLGFLPDVERILAQTPELRQTMLFSATIDDAVEKSIGKLLSNPVRVEVARRGEVADTVKQSLIRIPHALKPALLVALLKEKGSPRVIVFARTRGRADTCARRLNRAGIRAAAIHSDRSQAKRQRALADFESGKIDVIVGTDVLARGIDVNDVSYVVNFDLPDAPEDYVHRIGRTGRAGKGGEAISFVSPENKKILKEILKRILQL